MSYIKNFFLVLIVLFTFENTLEAGEPHYLDFKLILNKSIAGKKAQDTLQKQLDNGIKSMTSKEKSLLEDEKKIIQQKKVISQEEYIKKVNSLRKKVSELQKSKNILLEKIGKARMKARNELLKNLNPIIEQYMQEKKIIIEIDKKNIILADEKLDITNDILKLLNGKLKSIKID